MESVNAFVSHVLSQLIDPVDRPGLHPIPGTKALTFEAAICPPLIYYLALLFLPPAPPSTVDAPAIKLLRTALALLAGVLFLRLPLAYHVAQSVGLTYQLGLVGLYGGCRVIDAFFISPYIFGHVPRRVVYTHTPSVELKDGPKHTSADEKQSNDTSSQKTLRPNAPDRSLSYMEVISNGQVKGIVTPALGDGEDPFNRLSASDMLDNVVTTIRKASIVSVPSALTLSKTLSGPKHEAVTETAHTEDGWPHGFTDRASWALELEMSMRGVGFTWTTADVRHTRKTWRPSVANRLHSIFFHNVPVLAVCFVVIRTLYTTYLAADEQLTWTQDRGPYHGPFDLRLPFPLQLVLTTALGAFLMAAFGLAHSAFAIICSPLPSAFAYFPPLYTTPVWELSTVRGFWSYGWHRLFARLFLVYGVWPGEWLERTIMGKSADEPADLGKVLGGFLSSAFCHSFAVRGTLAGRWSWATGEGVFFATNGMAVIVEGVIVRWVRQYRKSHGLEASAWYDGWIGRIWWISVLLLSGRNFARGWVNAGLVREMSGL